MSIVKQDVLNFASELTNVSDDAWVDIIAYVNAMELTTADLEQDVRMAQIYLAAHIATFAKPNSGSALTAGPVTSESAGGVRRSYGLVATATSSTSIASTRYGRLYMDVLGRSLAVGPMVV